MISRSHKPLRSASTFVRFSDDGLLFVFVFVVLFVLVVIIVRVLRRQAHDSAKA